MTAILHPLIIVWIGLPFFLGFLIYLIPQMDRAFALVMVVASAVFAGLLFVQPTSVDLSLLDHFGVTLSADVLSAYFILTNALVTAAVLLYCWWSEKSAFFYAKLAIAHGSLNAAFICADFISLYVAIEVLSIAAFLLIAYPRTDRTIWVGLRYLFASNTAMLFYLMGAALVYQANHSFSFAGLQVAPPEAIALILLGLLAKGGIFLPGLWLPVTHSEAETPVSALLSGVVVKVGVFPLIRCALLVEEINPIVRLFGVATALLGVSYAVFEKDTKRMLAFHTISQMGFVLAAPVAGGFYALTHGLVKSCLFLISGNLPTRNFKDLQQKTIDSRIWTALAIASLSISGLPLLAGFVAKAWTLKAVLPWQVFAMSLASVGTAISFAKFIFVPRGGEQEIKPGFAGAVGLLLGGLVVANLVYPQAYTLAEMTKALITIGGGWLTYLLVFGRITVKLPRMLEQFEQLIGMMSLMLILLFWMVVT
ncbi:MAG TPA: cation:proton antiporter [Synechococcales cyanobacterium M55_K2018_004]|nr:cation:proton antiporter [Synechococcales cyanobacterium M55_K2018_004]